MNWNAIWNKRKATVPLLLLLSTGMTLPLPAQEVLTLEQCRELALNNNKQLKAARLGQDVAANTRKAAKTKYLPHVDGLAGYEHFSREVSILNDHQKSALSNLGSNAIGKVDSRLGLALQNLVDNNIVSPQAAQDFSQMMKAIGNPMAQAGDDLGNTIREAFRTNNKNIWAASVMVTQPIYMGGSIKAANEMAQISEDMARNQIDNATQTTLFAIDNAYWLAVSLKNKERLAKQYLELVQKLDDDVHKYIREGVATRADGLKVDVAVNHAEMLVTEVEDGVSLSKMYLCQLCGLPLDGTITLADEGFSGNGAGETWSEEGTLDLDRRPEVRLLQNAVDMSRQTTKLTQALYRPHIGLTGGVLFSNPNVFNGFEKKFKGMWNIGIIAQIPIWNWHEGRYKINATRTATQMAQLELDDIREKISLQVEQSKFKLKEAQKKRAMAEKNMASAEENLRCANIGFHEGVMSVTNVMEAQTAWQQAETQRIDADIDVHLSYIALQKALGTLHLQ